jgi:molybdopterin-guanine dinucleotide biosynthesis protein A
MTAEDHSNSVDCVILAGGQGNRMDGQDKGLIQLKGRPLVEWVIEALQPQVSQILISANRNLERYQQLGYPVFTDETEGFAGPLAGLSQAMKHASGTLILAVPCDTPFLPRDLVARLQDSLLTNNADIAFPIVEGRTQHAIMLCQRRIADKLEEYIREGGRKVATWQQSMQTVEVPFETPFLNINTQEDLRQAEHLAN